MRLAHYLYVSILSFILGFALIINPVIASTATENTTTTNNLDIETLRSTANAFFKPIPAIEDVIKEHQIDPKQKELGHKLFFEPRLSASQIITCNSCHSLGTGGADNIPVSIGHGWRAGDRNSPTVYNAIFNASQMWDGRFKDLADQAQGPMTADVEMNNTPEHVVATLQSIPEYVEFFAEAFPNDIHNDKNPVNFENTLSAIEAFEKTLVTPNSRFDQFLQGENSLNQQELAGLNGFIQTGCIACHTGINLGGQSFFKFGLVREPSETVRPAADKGLAGETGNPADEYVFRTSPLRNIALTAPYFHSGTVWELSEAVDIMAKTQLGRDLSEQEIADITAFLHTLTGEMPEVSYPILPPNSRTTPRPNAN